MPARSSAQRRYLNMKFGHDWVKKHHFDNKGKLPAHAKTRQGSQEDMVRRFMKRGKRRGRSRGKEARQ